MRSQALEDLFIQELKEIYDGEKQIYKGLDVMAKTATNKELASAFVTHRKQTSDQIKRIEKAFRVLGEKASRGKAAGVTGLIKTSRELIDKDSFDRGVVDAGLISSAQKIEHYEIAAYGCLRTHASILGYKEIEDLLNASLQEEEETDRILTKIATETVNVLAAAAPYSHARTGQRHAAASSHGGHSFGRLAIGLTLVGAALSMLSKPKAGVGTRAQMSGDWS
jgi:ferritin-like metal-binding protein YciE